LANWLKGSRFKGSEVDFTATLINEIKGKGKERDGNNPEPLNPDRPNLQFKGKIAVYKALRSILFD
jgi:hypothetical protein